MATSKKTPARKTSAKKAAPSHRAMKKPKQTASDSIDDQLAKYRSMRDFATTAEPSGGHGKATPQTALPFVIQKHAATRLHYDFRLGWKGVLKSWAVAKGPSYVVADKRLAVQVEDHPMEYGGFEGTIPKGQYGGGTVMLWDEGTWEPVGDGDEGLRTGRLKFILHGRKLQGHWTLVRMGGKAAQESKPNWLLIKEHDEYERPATAKSVTDAEPDSVITGRDLTQIAAAEDHVWDSRSGLAADERKAAAKSTTAKQSAKKMANEPEPLSQRPDVSRYPKKPIPGFMAPQLASGAATPPTGAGWVHELKLDGYRMQAHIDNGDVTIYSRNGLDWTTRVKGIAKALTDLPVRKAIIDGEVVALNDKGLSSFSELQAAFDERKSRELTYYCFDLLYLDGHSLLDAPLSDRKAILETLIADSHNANAMLRYSEHLEVDGAQMFREACALGAEGIISKQKASPYTAGRSASWTKTKCTQQQELVIGGFTPQANKNAGSLGALLVGYYHGDVLKYAGRTGTGFTQRTQKSLRERLEGLQQKSVPFDHVPSLAKKDAIWVKPELVAEVQFHEWTADGMVRQAAFKGLREDKPASEVRREKSSPEDAPSGNPKTDLPGALKAKSQPADKKRTAGPGPSSSIRLTHPDRVIDTESGLTKQVLAAYYEAVAERMLPHIANRPLSIVRCPDGSTGQCFFQKHAKTGLPKGVGSVDVPDKKTGKPEAYITLSTPEAIWGMAQMNVFELHPWGSRNEHLEQPDRLVFDLDPDESLPWEILAESAEDVRKRLAKLGLKSFLKGTGGKGLHIVAPIDPDPAHEWPVIKSFAHAFVQQMEVSNPKLYLTKMTKSARSGKIYLDYLRNERGATAVAPYSPRRRAGVPVSVPFAWTVLQDKSMPHHRVTDFQEWLGTMTNDPWKPLSKLHQTLTQHAIESVGVQL
jgi:bifunctional non-homologous end joining protein LigD